VLIEKIYKHTKKEEKMDIMPWKPRTKGLDIFHDFENLQQEMNRLFDFTLHKPLVSPQGALPYWTPAIDIIEEQDNVKVRADLPGIKKDEIEVAVENDVLTIKGEKKNEKEIKEKDYVRSERYYGAFHRSFTLPSAVDASKVNATYKDGVLEITLPKKEEAKSKQIKVDIK